jgi:hypothetical protein
MNENYLKLFNTNNTAKYEINNVQLILFGLNPSSIEECEKEFQIQNNFREKTPEISEPQEFLSKLFKLCKEIKTEEEFLLKSNFLLNFLTEFTEKFKSILDISNNKNLIQNNSDLYQIIFNDDTFRKILQNNDYYNYKRIIFQTKININSNTSNLKKLSNKFISYKYNIEEELDKKYKKYNKYNKDTYDDTYNNWLLRWFNKTSYKKSEPIETHFINIQNRTIAKDLYME